MMASFHTHAAPAAPAPVTTGHGNANYQRSIEAIKAKNGGQLPSELCLKTNAELCSLIYDLSGKVAAPRTAKTALVKRLEKLQQKAASAVPKIVVAGGSAGKNQKKPSKRGCLPSLGPSVVVEMRRVLALNDSGGIHTHTDLRKIWYKTGYTALYPARDSKANVVKRLKLHATRNLAYHGL